MKPWFAAMVLVVQLGAWIAPSTGAAQAQPRDLVDREPTSVLVLSMAAPGESASRLEKRLVRELHLILEEHGVQVAQFPASQGPSTGGFKESARSFARTLGSGKVVWIELPQDAIAEVHLMEIDTGHHAARRFAFDGSEQVASEMALAVNELLIAGLDGDDSVSLPTGRQAVEDRSELYGASAGQARPDLLDLMTLDCWGMGVWLHTGQTHILGSPDAHWQVGGGALAQRLFEGHVALTGLINGAYVPAQRSDGHTLSGSWWELGMEIQPLMRVRASLTGPIFGVYGLWRNIRAEDTATGWSLKMVVGLGASVSVSGFSALVAKATLGIFSAEEATKIASGVSRPAKSSHMDWGVFFGFVRYFPS